MLYMNGIGFAEYSRRSRKSLFQESVQMWQADNTTDFEFPEIETGNTTSAAWASVGFPGYGEQGTDNSLPRYMPQYISISVVSKT